MGVGRGGRGSLLCLCGSLLLVKVYSNPRVGEEGVVHRYKPRSKRNGPFQLSFANRLVRLLTFLVPGVFTREAGLLAAVATLLVSRTYCDIKMLHLTTAIEQAIVSRGNASFVKNVGQFARLMVPISCITALLKYSQAELQLAFRTRLTRHVLDKYMANGCFNYYALANLDTRIANPDQAITQDIEMLSESLADLYSNLTKPVLDIVIYSKSLSHNVDAAAPAMLIGYLILSGIALTAMRKPTSVYTELVQKAEGRYRHVNSRLLTSAEEVAFYEGNEKEKAVLQSTFNSLVGLVRRSQRFRFSMSIIDSIFAKYSATLVGFFAVSRPFLDRSHPRFESMSSEDVYTAYHTAGRMMLNMATALGQLVLSGRELARLSGFSAQVTNLIDVIDEVSEGKYCKPQVQTPYELGPDEAMTVEGEGIVERDHIIQFEKVPLITPTGDVLIRSLSMKVESGMNVLVVGPNGCGKSSMFRILGGLWPLKGGTLTKPKRENLFYIPARPYLYLGSLRDQLTYPDTGKNPANRAKGDTDAQLLEILQQVKLEYLLEREGGWGAVKDWGDILSGGEKQRLAMARLFYHRPQFAILDECTSAVSADVEALMYDLAREMGITLLTVSHRNTLFRHHHYLLRFDSELSAGYELTMIAAEE